MTPSTQHQIPATAADCQDIGDAPGWIKRVRSAAKAEGVALRAGDGCIEAKSLITNLWQPIMTPRNGSQFATPEDRDEVLAAILAP